MLLALETPKAVWYVLRGSGLVAFVLLSMTVALGVVGVKRWQSTRWSRLVTAGLHKNLALLALSFLAVHIVSAVFDSYIGLNVVGVVVPFVSSYRPLFVGLGVLALDLLVAVVGTSLLRRKVSNRAWRLVHFSTWLLWPLALVHALGAGTDSLHSWGLGVVALCGGTVVAAALWRLTPRSSDPAVSRQGQLTETGQSTHNGLPDPQSIVAA
jgi:sulfoxide reductase heme-binding subunit YedZ